jgi:hypothetical protein
LPCRWDALADEFEEYFLQRQGQLEERGRDPGMASVVNEFVKAKKLAGLDRQAFL